MPLASAFAQEEAASPELPTVASLAAALSDPQLRQDALLTMAAVARLHARMQAPAGGQDMDSLANLVNDREWLLALQTRFGASPPRSPVLDPAAWRLQTQLDQHDLQAGYLVSPMGPGPGVLLSQVFNRVNPRLAFTVLPEVLWHMEVYATVVWSDLLERAETDPELALVLAGLGTGLFGAWPTAEDSFADGLPADELMVYALRSLETLVAEASEVGPPDPFDLAALRFQVLVAMPGLEDADREIGAIILHLAGLIDGLNEGRYLHFTEGLLASAAQLENIDPALTHVLDNPASWLAGVLPVISRSYSHAFAAVDPRLNSALAAAFDVARGVARDGEGGPSGPAAQQLADAVAKLALLIPDMDYYFDLPVRDPVAGGVDACTGIVAVRDPDGSPAMTRELFDDCQQTLVDLVDKEAREAQLAGDPDGPFGESHLQRELNLTAGQRINYGIGYLHDRYSTGCEAPGENLPNPLEWAYLATFMAWFAQQSPVYFQTPENEARLVRMREIGLQLMQVVAEQVDCIAGAGAGVNDPVNRVSADYRDNLRTLGRGLRNSALEFRGQFLAPGADVALDGGAQQSTSYRPDKVQIGPCDPGLVCEMSGDLSATRALLGLFPDPYLVADQTGMGRVEICYEQMEWVDRRSEPVRSDDKNVANYYGQLSFDLKGRFVSASATTDLFSFRFRTPEEHHYMFAAATEEVLDDSCPVEWIGNRIVTTLPEGRRAIVPNRLTYLSAARTLPSRLLDSNWDQGAEWRDRFVTGIGVERLPLPPPADITAPLNQHLQSLYRLEQDAVLGTLMEPGPNSQFDSLTPLHEDMARLSTSKDLIRTQMMLFYPKVLNESDDLRGAIAGHNGLLDTAVLNRYRDERVPVAEMLETSRNNLDKFQDGWAQSPEAVRRNGSIATGMSHALVRLNALYEAHFALPAENTESVRAAGDAPSGH